MITYLLMGLTFLVPTTLIQAAIRVANGGSWWVWPLMVLIYIALWPIVMIVWVYRAIRLVPERDAR